MAFDTRLLGGLSAMTAVAEARSFVRAGEALSLTKPREITPLVQILADWADERWPLYAYHVSRHHPPAKVRAFMDFVVALVRREWPR